MHQNCCIVQTTHTNIRVTHSLLWHYFMVYDDMVNTFIPATIEKRKHNHLVTYFTLYVAPSKHINENTYYIMIEN